MRRADRLFEIIQILRLKKLARAQDLAARLEVSERTIYRDIRDLMAAGVPIEGEAGVGYVLQHGFDLPPMMFDELEVEALALGARIVESWADPELAGAAANVMAKVEAVLPDRLRPLVAGAALLAPARHYAEPVGIDPASLRSAIRSRTKVKMAYRDGKEQATERVVRPLALSFYGPIWCLVAWCELRDDFRSFRLDRIGHLEVLDLRFRLERGKTLQDYLRREAE